MRTEKSNNRLLIAVIVLALLLVITIGSAHIALNNHVESERQKDAQIDSLETQLAWHELQWNNVSDEDK
jgi:competence protein ComGC